MAMISWAGWPGYTHGVEVSLVDLMALAIYLSLPRSEHHLPFKWPMAFYFITVLLSVLQAAVPQATLFYAWQLARIFFFYAVLEKASADSRVAPALLKGMALGLLLATCQAVWQRFGLGIVRTTGGYQQENFFGIVSHFVVFPFFALLLAGQRGWLPPTISFSGVLISILTVSRATLGVTGSGFGLLFLVSAFRRWTARKALVMAVAATGVLMVVPFFISSFADRFGSSIGASFLDVDDTRVKLAEAAGMMLSDHPMGVGANQFVVVGNTAGYYAHAGLSWVNFGATVHNVYWLVAAETGYLGLIAFVIMLLRPLFVAFSCGWRARGDKRGDLLLGLGMALLAVYFHSFFEWVFVDFQIQYLFATTVGLIAGTAQQLGYWSKPVRSSVTDRSKPSPVIANGARPVRTMRSINSVKRL